jgi:hypothetical protein
VRRRGRVDANQGEIVKALHAAGCSVESLAAVGKGVPDLLVGLRSRNVLIEVVGPAKRKRFPPDGRSDNQREWHKIWAGQVLTVTSAEDALQQLDLIGKGDIRA